MSVSMCQGDRRLRSNRDTNSVLAPNSRSCPVCIFCCLNNGIIPWRFTKAQIVCCLNPLFSSFVYSTLQPSDTMAIQPQFVSFYLNNGMIPWRFMMAHIVCCLNPVFSSFVYSTLRPSDTLAIQYYDHVLIPSWPWPSYFILVSDI